MHVFCVFNKSFCIRISYSLNFTYVLCNVRVVHAGKYVHFNSIANQSSWLRVEQRNAMSIW